MYPPVQPGVNLLKCENVHGNSISRGILSIQYISESVSVDKKRVAVQNRKRRGALFYSATQTAAIPIPVPTHMEVTPIFLLVRVSSVSKVLTWREPVQPRG